MALEQLPKSNPHLEEILASNKGCLSEVYSPVDLVRLSIQEAGLVYKSAVSALVRYCHPKYPAAQQSDDLDRVADQEIQCQHKVAELAKVRVGYRVTPVPEVVAALHQGKNLPKCPVDYQEVLALAKAAA